MHTASRGPRIFLIVLLVATTTALPTNDSAAAGELRLAGPVSGFDSLDPAISRDLSSNSVLRQIFRGLVGFDDALRPVPELAETITPSADGMRYAVRLRDTAVFHDGTPVEAEDVAFSLTRAVSPATVDGDVTQLGGPTFLGAIAGYEDVVSGRSSTLSGVVVEDARNLRIELSAPQSTFVMRLAAVPASIVDREQVGRDVGWAASPNGSGPFRVTTWTPGEELILEAHEGYALGRPTTERVRFRLGSAALQPFNLFQADEIDLDSVSALDVGAVAAQQSSLGASLVETPGFSLTYLAFRSDVAPLDDIHVRRAVRLAFPSREVAAITMEGRVTAARGVVPDGMLGATWPARLDPYDLDAARAELALSRYGGAAEVPTIRVDVSGSYAAEAFLDAVEGDLGIDVEIVDHDPATFFDGLADGDYMAHELTWGADYPDPATFLASLFGGSSPDNYLGFYDPDVDRLLDEANAALDDATRVDRYAEAQQRILDAAVVIPLFHGIQYTLVRDGVSGVSVTPMGILRLETISVSS